MGYAKSMSFLNCDTKTSKSCEIVAKIGLVCFNIHVVQCAVKGYNNFGMLHQICCEMFKETK